METINMRNFCIYFIVYKLINWYEIVMHWKYKEITNLDCILFKNVYCKKFRYIVFFLKASNLIDKPFKYIFIFNNMSIFSESKIYCWQWVRNVYYTYRALIFYPSVPTFQYNRFNFIIVQVVWVL